MVRMEMKKYKGNYKIDLFENEKNRGQKWRREASYWNIIDKDKEKLAQIFIDLYFQGFPIVEAFKLMQEKLNKKEWF